MKWFFVSWETATQQLLLLLSHKNPKANTLSNVLESLPSEWKAFIGLE